MAPKTKQKAKMPFKAPFNVPGERLAKPHAPEDSEEVHNRVPAYMPPPQAHVPKPLKAAVEERGLSFKPELPYSMARAVEESGRKGTDPFVRRTVEKLSAKGVRFGSGSYDALVDEREGKAAEEEPELEARPFADQVLRKVFADLDLNNNDFIEAAELRHVFAQLGEMPSDNEISGMMHLCDRQGNGTVNFDDFLSIFSEPAMSLRNADVKGLKRLMPRKAVDFDIREPLGMLIVEHTKLRETFLLVEEVRRDTGDGHPSQAWDQGVKRGWRLILMDGQPVITKKQFESQLEKLQDAIDPAKKAAAKLEASVAKAKARKSMVATEIGDPVKAPYKYDTQLTFLVNPGDVEESSSDSSMVEDDSESEFHDSEEDA